MAGTRVPNLWHPRLAATLALLLVSDAAEHVLIVLPGAVLKAGHPLFHQVWFNRVLEVGRALLPSLVVYFGALLIWVPTVIWTLKRTALMLASTLALLVAVICFVVVFLNYAGPYYAASGLRALCLFVVACTLVLASRFCYQLPQQFLAVNVLMFSPKNKVTAGGDRVRSPHLALRAPHPRLAATFALVVVQPFVLRGLNLLTGWLWRPGYVPRLLSPMQAYFLANIGWYLVFVLGSLLIWAPTIRWTPSRRRWATYILAVYVVLLVTAYEVFVDIGLLYSQLFDPVAVLASAAALVLLACVCWTAPEGPLAERIRCPACGYDLRGQHECRCPECGRQFTVAELLQAVTAI